MYNKEELFNQAHKGGSIVSKKINSISLINIGVKISKYSSKIY